MYENTSHITTWKSKSFTYCHRNSGVILCQMLAALQYAKKGMELFVLECTEPSEVQGPKTLVLDFHATQYGIVPSPAVTEGKSDTTF